MISSQAMRRRGGENRRALLVGLDPGPVPARHSEPVQREAETQQAENPGGHGRQVEHHERRERQGEPAPGHQAVREHGGRRIAVSRHSGVVAPRAIRQGGAAASRIG